jgi:hypothetical protein
LLHLVQIEPRLGDRDAGADIDAIGNFGLECVCREMSPRVERNNTLWIAPLLEWPDGRSRKRIGEIGAPDDTASAR